LLFGTAEGPAVGSVGGAENRSGVVSAGGRVGMPPIMPPAPHRDNGLGRRYAATLFLKQFYRSLPPRLRAWHFVLSDPAITST
jgi:hypothetical protein